MGGRQQVESHAYMVRQTDQKNRLQTSISQLKYCSCIQPVFQHSLSKSFQPIDTKGVFHG
ncbi:MAG: hypothetical protein EBX02_13020 [Betaproteobacteria bacterium]|nr:hypothetical protein [Betaproteobacteria bacterium]